LTVATATTTTPETHERTGITERARAERKLGWLLCAPSVVVMIAVTAYPIGYSIWLSLQHYDLRFPERRGFAGLSNYGTVLGARLWWNDVVNTLVLMVISVAVEFVLGMLIALAMHKALFGRRTVRATALIPYSIVTVVAGFAWKFAFDANTGFVNGLLGLHSSWFGSRLPAMFVIILNEVWKTTPFMALLLLAGLVLVPNDLVNAARVDGAGTWQRFRLIMLPIMRPAILVAVLFRCLDAFRIFDSIFVITSGAVGTESVSIIGYNQLLDRLNLGLGSAVSVLIFVGVLIIAFAFVKGFGASLAQQRGEEP
jgi:multiple sugar transport system permease protein